MRAAEKKRRGATAKRSEARQLPGFVLPGKTALAVAALAFFAALLFVFIPGEESTDSSKQIASELESPPNSPGSDLWRVSKPTIPESARTVAELPVETAALAPAEQPWLDQVVKKGDNLSLIFQRAGFKKGDVHQVVTGSAEGKSLARIYPGQIISFQSDASGELAAVRVVRSPLETIIYRKSDQGFSSEVLSRTPETRESWATAEITSSLFMAGKEAGLSHTTIMDLATIFGGVIDFVQDPRQGDTIQVVYEEFYLDDKKYADGAIIAASFTNQGKTYNAFRYVDASGDANYYNEDGVSMRKAFLLAPVDFTRISSNFNLRRLHPIYKTTRPHRGTDYAAPTGTPVYAAGDGRVVKAGYTGANGNYVFIQHGDQYVTRYLHLNKRLVKSGQRVDQSQVIGTVGSTGAATGPHLHYEFLVNGVHRDPRKIHQTLPKARTLPATEMTAFRASIHESSQQLAALRSDNHLAMNGSANLESTAN
ncbi:MAG: peptidoglycan DD-metalloendopeptidase family protein [Halieaceae bacterium]|jgi:murein DD-endopeptidase MepM/ murein hydrolase activator NlpD|nr:peptidoglycan DD-metalloendopeptidase family protein [Halieaceae bacterium]